jgi:LysR family transcriptional regulator, glycine cleavage system transcriptional activator
VLRRLPPLNAVKAFDAAARSSCFTRVAEERHFTPGAVGQQAKAPELTLGLKLFNRERRRVVISEAAATILPRFAMRSLRSRRARNALCGGNNPAF